MGLDKDSRHGSILIGIAARLTRWVMLALGRSWKIEIAGGREHLDRLLGNPRPVILSFWHNRAFAGSFFFFDLHRRGLDVTLLASHSRDGELVTRVFRRWGIHTVRGSASRGGLQALRAIHRAITRRGSSPIMIPDGPRGPLYQFKVGVAVLAQTSRAPILPFGIAAEKFWTLASWDRLIVPRPFSRIAVTVGEPQHIDRGLAGEELEAQRQRLQELLDGLTLRAEAAVGARDLARS